MRYGAGVPFLPLGAPAVLDTVWLRWRCGQNTSLCACAAALFVHGCKCVCTPNLRQNTTRQVQTSFHTPHGEAYRGRWSAQVARPGKHRRLWRMHFRAKIDRLVLAGRGKDPLPQLHPRQTSLSLTIGGLAYHALAPGVHGREVAPLVAIGVSVVYRASAGQVDHGTGRPQLL